MKEMLKWLEDKFNDLKDKAKLSGDKIKFEFDINEWNITCLLVEEFIKTYSFSQIEKLSLSRLQPIRENSSEKDVLSKIIFDGQNLDNSVMDTFLKPIKDSLILFEKNFQEFQQTPLNCSEDLKKFLLSNGLTTLESDLTLANRLTDIIRKKIKNFNTEFMTNQLKNLYPFKRVTERLIVTLVSVANEKNENGNPIYNITDLKMLGLRTNIYTNELLVEALELPPDKVRGLIDAEPLLDKFEQGTLSSKYRKYLYPEDYIFRYLKYSSKGDTEKENLYSSKISIKGTIQAFKSNIINFDILLDTFKNLSKVSSKREQIKREVKKLFINSKNNETEPATLSPKNILELAKINLVSDTDLIQVFMAQEDAKINSPSSNIYQEEYSHIFISEEEVNEYFSAERLLNHYLNNHEKADISYSLSFYKHYIINENVNSEKLEVFQTELLNDHRITPKIIVDLFSYGIITVDKFCKILTKNPEIKVELYKNMRELKTKYIFDMFNYDIIDENDLIECFGDDYEAKLREGFSKGQILSNKLEELEYLDNKIVMEEYEKSIQMRITGSQQNEISKTFNFIDLVFTYIVNDKLVHLDDIVRAASEAKDPVFQQKKFDVHECICYNIEYFHNSSRNPVNLTSKIRDLYFNDLLTFDTLARLTEKGIISSEDAQDINKEYCNKEMLKKLKKAKLGGSLENEPTQKEEDRVKIRKDSRNQQEKEPTKESLVSQQTDVMLEILKQYGFEPITTETNAYGYSEIQSFNSGNFENYMVLLSEEIPEVAILMHSKHVQNSDIYYQTGGNATYILSTAKLKTYLEQVGALESKFSHLAMTKQSLKTDDPYLRTANVTKNWGRNVARKIDEVLHMLEQPVLEEQSTSIDKQKTRRSFKPETLLPTDLSAIQSAERLEAIEIFNEELVNLKRQIENDENHGI